MWLAEADTELTLSASPATAVGQSKLTLANLGLNTVAKSNKFFIDFCKDQASLIESYQPRLLHMCRKWFEFYRHIVV